LPGDWFTLRAFSIPAKSCHRDTLCRRAFRHAAQRSPIHYDFCVIGGGIVGLATARELLLRRPTAGVLVLEKDDGLASHQTGRNSGVIHAGVYYAPRSLKARLCREGNRATQEFCAEHRIPVLVCGKLIVATNPVEVGRLAELKTRCRVNEIGTQDLTGHQLQEVEPAIQGLAAILVPSTGIVDYKSVAEAMGADCRRLGGVIRTASEAERIQEDGNGITVTLTSGEHVRTRQLIACAGLQADRLARASGLRCDMRIVPFRGEYFRLPDTKSELIKHLIYPVPDPDLPFLGVHLTRMIGGEVTVGPNAVLSLGRESYDPLAFGLRDALDTLQFPGFWRLIRTHWRSAISELHTSLSRGRYLRECRKYCPELELSDLLPYRPGIRAQAVLRDGTLVHDFMLVGTPRSVHVLNAPSPAATAALPIAGIIVDRVLEGRSSVG